jgi:hypothetical protein
MVVLFPLGIYCLIIGRINRRRRPVLVSGIRDCAGMLLGLSGFLFFLWPSLITGFNYSPRDIWLYNHYSSLRSLGHEWWWTWWLSQWLVYLVVVFGGSFLLLWRRRNVTVVYNVAPALLDGLLDRVLDRLDLPWMRSQRHILIGDWSLPAQEADKDPPNGPSERFARGRDYRTVLEVNPWPAFRHVTLHWSTEAGHLRPAVDAALRRALAQVRTPENPAGHWLMAVCACLFTLLFVLTVLFQISRLRGDW